MGRWRIAIVVEVDGDTEDEAVAAAEAISSAAGDDGHELYGTWPTFTEARIESDRLGPLS